MNNVAASTELAFEAVADFVGPLEKPDVVSQPAEDLVPGLNYKAHTSVELEKSNTKLTGTIANLVSKFGSLSSLIRVVGVAAVVVSMCLFLFDGMGAVNDTQRFFTMLMLTGLLSAGGFSLAFILKEHRGARSFFGLALLSVPVNFTVLGALFYSVIQFDKVSTAYPTMAHWEILDVASLGTTVLIAALALIPVTILGVSVLAREGRSWLGIALLASSSLLLFPIRDTTWIAPLVAIMVVVLISVVKRFGANTISLNTLSGRFVQTLLFLPPAIMLFRSFWLYEVTALSSTVICLTIYAALRFTSQRISSDGIVVNALHIVSAFVALVTGVMSLIVFEPISEPLFLAVPFSLMFGGLMLELESRVNKAEFAQVLGIGASVLVACVTVLHQQVYDVSGLFYAGLIVPVIMIIVAAAQQHKGKMIIGTVTLLTIFLIHASDLFMYFTQTGWLGFASLGGIAILVASLLERFGPMLSIKSRRWFTRAD